MIRPGTQRSILLIAAATLFACASSPAQKADHYTPQSLIEQSQSLIEKARATNGAAAVTLEKYGVDFTMLSVRTRDGRAEVHEKFADIFVIVDGQATLLSGGEMKDPATIGPGELHGTSIIHATETRLGKGDVIHIPPNTPHQLLIPKGTTLTYFVVKVKEVE